MRRALPAALQFLRLSFFAKKTALPLVVLVWGGHPALLCGLHPAFIVIPFVTSFALDHISRAGGTAYSGTVRYSLNA